MKIIGHPWYPLLAQTPNPTRKPVLSIQSFKISTIWFLHIIPRNTAFVEAFSILCLTSFPSFCLQVQRHVRYCHKNLHLFVVMVTFLTYKIYHISLCTGCNLISTTGHHWIYTFALYMYLYVCGYVYLCLGFET